MEPIRSHRAAVSPEGCDGESRSGAGDEGSVYPPREDSLLLLPFAEVASGSRFLEIGSGAGVAALAAAHRGARVVATDRNPFALRRLGQRSRAEGVEVGVVRTDLARGLGRFDRVVSNPPYLPTRPEERDPDHWHNLALDGGPDGCRVTARIVAELDRHLLEGGAAFVVVSSLQDAQRLDRIRDDWCSRHGTVEVVASRTLEGERLEVWRFGAPRG